MRRNLIAKVFSWVTQSLRVVARFVSSKATFSNVVSLISLAISICGTLATIYYNFFWNQESLYVNYTIKDISDADEGAFSVSFLFSNTGKQTALIEELRLIQIAGTKIDLDECASSRVSTAVQPRRWTKNGKEKEGERVVKVFKPTAVLVDNEKAITSSFLVEPANLKALTLTFEPEKLTVLGKKNVVYCFTITYADRLGKMFTRPLPGWIVGISTMVNPNDSIWYSYSEYHWQPFQLLPAVDKMDTWITVGRYNPAWEKESPKGSGAEN